MKRVTGGKSNRPKILTILFLALLGGCAEYDSGIKPAWEELIVGTYRVDIRHFDVNRSIVQLSETAEVTVIQDSRESFYDVLIFNDTLRIANFNPSTHCTVFQSLNPLVDHDDFGFEYLMEPNDQIEVNGVNYSGFFEIREHKIKLFFKKVYKGLKALPSGFIEIEGYRTGTVALAN